MSCIYVTKSMQSNPIQSSNVNSNEAAAASNISNLANEWIKKKNCTSLVETAMETEHQRSTYTITVTADFIGQFAVCSQTEEFERKTDFCDEWWINKMNKEKKHGFAQENIHSMQADFELCIWIIDFLPVRVSPFPTTTTKNSLHFCNLISV